VYDSEKVTTKVAEIFRSNSEYRTPIYGEGLMGAGTGGAGGASAHPGKNQGGHGPPWKF